MIGLQRVRNKEFNRPPVVLAHSGTDYVIQSRGLEWKESRISVILGMRDDGLPEPVRTWKKIWRQPIPPAKFKAPHAELYLERDGVPCTSPGQMRLEKDHKDYPTDGLLEELTNRKIRQNLTPDELATKSRRLKEIETELKDWTPKDPKLKKAYLSWLESHSVRRNFVDVEPRIWAHWNIGGNRRTWTRPDPFTGEVTTALTTDLEGVNELTGVTEELAEIRKERERLSAEVGELKNFRAREEARDEEIASLRATMAKIDEANDINEVRKLRGNV